MRDEDYKAGRSLWPDGLPPEYIVQVERIRENLLKCPAFQRPAASPSWRRCDTIYRGRLFTRSRVVDVSVGGPARHIAAAMKGTFPKLACRWQGCLDIDPDLQAAIDASVEKNKTKTLAKFRGSQNKLLSEGATANLPPPPPPPSGPMPSLPPPLPGQLPTSEPE